MTDVEGIEQLPEAEYTSSELVGVHASNDGWSALSRLLKKNVEEGDALRVAED